MIIEVKTLEEFQKITAYGECLVDFFATWCGPCKMLSPVLLEADETEALGNVKIVEVDVDRLAEVAAKYGIQAVPTLILLKDGVEIKRNLGYQNKTQLINFVGK